MRLEVIFIISSLFLLVSCGEQLGEEDEITDIRNLNAYDWNTSMRDEELLSEDEFDIALRICSSFQKMRSFLTTQSTALNLEFRVEVKKCGDSDNREYSEKADLVYSRSSGVELNSRAGSSLAKDVLSDQHTRLSYMCSEVFNSSRPSNMIIDGELRYQINFFTVGSFDWLQIAEFKKNDSGIYYPYLIEKASIVTESSGLNSDAIGFTKNRALHRPCSNNYNSYVLQEWL